MAYNFRICGKLLLEDKWPLGLYYGIFLEDQRISLEEPEETYEWEHLNVEMKDLKIIQKQEPSETIKRKKNSE